MSYLEQIRMKVMREEIATLEQSVEHLRAHIAVLIVRLGGEVTVTNEELAQVYDLAAAATPDDLGIEWTSVARGVE